MFEGNIIWTERKINKRPIIQFSDPQVDNILQISDVGSVLLFMVELCGSGSDDI